jgi:hypothetical protein
MPTPGRWANPHEVLRLYGMICAHMTSWGSHKAPLPVEGWLLACGDAQGQLHTYRLQKDLGPKADVVVHNVLQALPTFIREVQITSDGVVVMACDHNLVVLCQ